MEEKILTPDQVAQTLQVHPFTVLKFIKQGKLQASRLGRVYRIRESDVNRFLDNQLTRKEEKASRPSVKTAKKDIQASKVEEQPESPKEISSDALRLGSELKEEALPEKMDLPKKTDTSENLPRASDDPLQPDHYYILN